MRCARRRLSRMKALGLALVISLAGAAHAQGSLEGQWHAWLDSAGGELPFGLELHGTEKQVQATIVNGSERIAVETSHDGEAFVLDFPHYDSRITAHGTGTRLDGTWRKRRGADAWAELGFHADRNVRVAGTEDAAPIFRQLEASVAHRYSVRFSSSDDPAVAILEADAAGLRGTFLTTTGDYRYLAGECTLPAAPAAESRVLHVRLSCFDGAHAFLFIARLVPRSTPGPVQLEGDFWSGDRW